MAKKMVSNYIRCDPLCIQEVVTYGTRDKATPMLLQEYIPVISDQIVQFIRVSSRQC